MAMMMSRPVALRSGLARAAPSLPVRIGAPTALRLPQRAQAAQNDSNMQGAVVKAAAWSTMASSFLAAGNACAATEVMQQAASDGRGNLLLALPAIAIGWVLFNIGGPAMDQLGGMNGGKNRGKRVASVVGLMAAGALAAAPADAAQEVAQLAGDNRVGIILTLFLPPVDVRTVLFNIGGPALSQFSDTASRNAKAFSKSGGIKGGTKSNKRRGVAAAIGSGLTAASLLGAQSADAATEVAQVAGDSRVGVIATLFVPIVGWVLFNIGGPAINQFQATAAKTSPKKGGRR